MSSLSWEKRSRRVILRADGNRDRVTSLRTVATRGPDNLTTATPARPGALASAKIVSGAAGPDPLALRLGALCCCCARGAFGAVPQEALELLEALPAERKPGAHH